MTSHRIELQPAVQVVQWLTHSPHKRDYTGSIPGLVELLPVMYLRTEYSLRTTDESQLARNTYLCNDSPVSTACLVLTGSITRAKEKLHSASHGLAIRTFHERQYTPHVIDDSVDIR